MEEHLDTALKHVRAAAAASDKALSAATVALLAAEKAVIAKQGWLAILEGVMGSFKNGWYSKPRPPFGGYTFVGEAQLEYDLALAQRAVMTAQSNLESAQRDFKLTSDVALAASRAAAAIWRVLHPSEAKAFDTARMLSDARFFGNYRY